MAKVSFKMPDDFLIQLSKLGDKTDEVIPKVLEVGAQVVLDKVKSNLASSLGKNLKFEGRSTGKLISSLGITTAKLDRNGNYNVKVGFAENRPDGVSNGKIANILEYGKHGQPPKPFLKSAKNQTKSACIEAMKEKFSEEIKTVCVY